MSGDLKTLLVIPARGGSKGIPKKNIKLLAGKPLIAYAIEASLGVQNHLEGVWVSTDSEDIADIAKQYGAEVPFMRPDELATDTAPSLPVIQHAVNFFEKEQNTKLDWVILLQATNPFVQSNDLENVLDMMSKYHKEATAIVSVFEAQDAHPLKVKVIEDGFLKPFIPDALEGIRRQDLKPLVYLRNGSIYATKRDVLMEQNDLYGANVLPYIMPKNRSFDIDDEADWEISEYFLEKKKTLN